MVNMKRSALCYLPALCWTALILLLTLLPGKDVPNTFFDRIPYFDKWVHATLFLGFVILWSWGLYKNRSSRHFLPALIIIALAGIMLGIGIEYLQRTKLVGRDFDVWDMVADAPGALVAVVILYLLLRKKRSGKDT